MTFTTICSVILELDKYSPYAIKTKRIKTSTEYQNKSRFYFVVKYILIQIYATSSSIYIYSVLKPYQQRSPSTITSNKIANIHWNKHRNNRLRSPYMCLQKTRCSHIYALHIRAKNKTFVTILLQR